MGIQAKKTKLKILLIDILKKDLYPSTREVVKLASVLPYGFAKNIINIAKTSRLFIVTKLVQKIYDKIDLKDKNRIKNIKKHLFGSGFHRNIDIKNKTELTKIVEDFIGAEKLKRGDIKHDWRIFDLLFYGEKLLK